MAANLSHEIQKNAISFDFDMNVDDFDIDLMRETQVAGGDAMAELMDEAAGLLAENPDMPYELWRDSMLANFPIEIVDAFGAGVSESDLGDLFEEARRKISPSERD